MNTEQWEQWNPIQGLAKKYYFDFIIDEIKKFKIILIQEGDPTKKVIVTFERPVYAYRCTDESYRLETIADLDERYGGDFYAKWTFFKLTDSSYLRWISGQSYNSVDAMPLIHFSFFTESILDVISRHEPKIEFIESK